MRKKTIYRFNSLYRDDFRITGYEFGKGKKSVCVIGNTRGNEVQQIYICSQLIKRMKKLEEEGKICSDKKILIIPSANPYSMNIKKRFWPTDNTDINRMFPGYNLGETTQRIASGLFQSIKDYKYGIQFTSFYMPGRFMPHVRMMKEGIEDVELASKFGLPYVVLRNVRPYDTTTLNYNWQVWDTNAFSIYTTTTEQLDKESANQAIRSILNFMSKQGIIEYSGHDGYVSMVVEDTDMVPVRTHVAGIFESDVNVGDEVQEGQVLARILDPYEGEVIETLKAPRAGIVFFEHNEPLTYSSTAVFKLIATES